MKAKDEIASEFKKRKSITVRGLSEQWSNTRDCQDFYAGNFMSYRDTVTMPDGRGARRPQMVQFSVVKPYVNAVRGFMAQNRRNADYVARIDEDRGQVEYSEYANALKAYVRENANADQTETQQDGDLLICGYGAVETALTYGQGYSSRNPNGEIAIGRLDPRHIGWDPTARMPNILDARWVYYEKIYAKTEALDLFDNSKPQDFEDEVNDDAGNKVFYPRGGRYNKIQEVYDYEDEDEDLVKVYFYQWYEIEKFYRAKNPLRNITDQTTYAYFDGVMQEIAADQDADDLYRLDPRAEIISCDAKTKKEIEDVFGDLVDFMTEKRRVYYTAVLSGTKVFDSYRSPCQQGFTVKFKTGDYDETRKMWVGMVNSLREPAIYYNKAISELLFTIASQSKGGVYIERGATDNIARFEAQYAKTDGVIEVNEGALTNGRIQPKKEAYTANGIDQILQLSQDALPMVSGIDKNFLGSSENKQETAALQRQRIRQVTTALATYFDNITLYQKEHAELLLPLMRILAENNDGTMFKSMTSDGDIEFMRMSPDNFADDYDVSIQEAPDTATQNEERAEVLIGMAQQLFAVQDVSTAKGVLAVAVKYAPLDLSDQQKLIEILVPDTPAIDPQYVQQLETQVKQLMDDGNQAQIKKILADAGLSLVKAEEVIANIRNKNADTGKKEAETERTEVETSIAARSPVKETNISL